MAHYAYVNDGVVTSVIVGRDEDDIPEGFEFDTWEEYFSTLGKGQSVRTSYNTYGGVHYTDGVPSEDQTKALRFNYAGIGFAFDPDRGTDGAFIPPKPFESWVLDEDTCLWVAPLPYPDDEGSYSWNEDLFAWELVDNG